MEFTINLAIILADQFMLFMINVLVARHAGEELFGDFNVATNGLLLLATIITFGIDSIIAYYIPKFYVNKRYQEIHALLDAIKNFLKPIYLGFGTLSIFICLIIVALAKVIQKLALFEVGHPLFLFLWATIAISLYNIFLQLFRAIGYMRTAILLSLFQTICYFLFSLFITYYAYQHLFHDNPHYFAYLMLAGFALSYIVTVIVSFAIHQKSHFKLGQQFAKQQWPEWKDKMYGYMVQNLNRYVFTAIPLLIIEWLGKDETSVGLFAAVTSIISLAFIAIAPIGILIGPDISAAFAQSRDMLKKTMKHYLLVCFGVSLIIALIIGFSAKYILILYQSDFISALPYTYACLINIVTYSISMPLTKMIQYSQKGSLIGAKLTLSMLLFQTVLSLIIIPWLGLLGAVICYVSINIIYNITMIFIAQRIYRNDQFGQEAIK